ncbi:MAG: hypothetical protein OXG15_10225 [Gammaproteobacteria bacterium]|nr:hypothetical protein [Gammaproteobacteria bacterium]
MVQTVAEQFTGAVDLTYTMRNSHEGFFRQAWVKISAVPTTSESVAINYINNDIAVELESINPQTQGETDIFFFFSHEVALAKNDKIQITFPNTDGNTVNVGIMITDRVN